jgi:hypothetical protein
MEERDAVGLSRPAAHPPQPPAAVAPQVPGKHDDIGRIATNAAQAELQESQISLHEVDPVSVRLDRLSVTVDQSPAWLDKLSFSAPSGSASAKDAS